QLLLHPRLRRRVAHHPLGRPFLRRLENRSPKLTSKQSLRNSPTSKMKLKLDSGLGARKQLAQELGYTGALDGSAEMNVWLHKQVMTKLAESGGKVPDSLKAAGAAVFGDHFEPGREVGKKHLDNIQNVFDRFFGVQGR